MHTRNNPESAKYRDDLPQLSGGFFLTDGGLETTLIFHEGMELPEFAAFGLLEYEAGRTALRRYFDAYASIAQKNNVGFILESPTWRANPDWGAKLGYSPAALAALNRQAIEFLGEIRQVYENGRSQIVLSGCIGPRGDGYSAGDRMSAAQAEDYHRAQIEVFAETAADMVSALTMTYAEEAIGIVRAAQNVGLPASISFTVETDGRLPSGQSLQAAIEQVDAATENGPIYYMINCAHPTHFEAQLDLAAPWSERLGGIRANASRLSHTQLDEADELDDGDPGELGQQYARLQARLKNLTVYGGCCGTDQRHIAEIFRACAPEFAHY